MQPLLTIEALSHRYPHAERLALKGVELAIGPGEFHALLGPNGAGKSTLFSLVCGLRTVTSGQVVIDGASILAERQYALGRLGVVFQQPTLDLDLTVTQNLRYFAALNGLSGAKARTRIEQELARQALSDRAATPVRQLNGGHRRRVEVARALLHQPRLLLFDEPTVGLDVSTRQALVAYVHELCAERGVGVLWATHLVDEVQATDQVSLLDQGRIVAQGGCDRLLAERGASDLKALFRQLASSQEDPAAVAL